MKENRVIEHIVNWLKDYKNNSSLDGFIIGVSGGIDSALASTLVAKTQLPVLCLEMPIYQDKDQIQRGKDHIKWLKKKFQNVTSLETDLTNVFKLFQEETLLKQNNTLALANARSRLRMMNIYYYAQIHNYLVVGTGNKVEDFGIGFFTKYGDGGIDISPIADLLKTEVYQLSSKLKINHNILDAPPTDGLWQDNKTDLEQIGATYPELEWAMHFNGNKKTLSEKEKNILSIYENMNKKNKHKMTNIPVCIIPEILK